MGAVRYTVLIKAVRFTEMYNVTGVSCKQGAPCETCHASDGTVRQYEVESDVYAGDFYYYDWCAGCALNVHGVSPSYTNCYGCGDRIEVGQSVISRGGNVYATDCCADLTDSQVAAQYNEWAAHNGVRA